MPLFVLAASALMGCATFRHPGREPTEYQATGPSGGFSETQLHHSAWFVNFYGNAYTSDERVLDFLLLRSAELTLRNGFRYFIIASQEDRTRHDSFTTPTATFFIGQIATTYGGQTEHVSWPAKSHTIVCFAQHPPETAGFTYDAQVLEASISKKYHLLWANDATPWTGE